MVKRVDGYLPAAFPFLLHFVQQQSAEWPQLLQFFETFAGLSQPLLLRQLSQFPSMSGQSSWQHAADSGILLAVLSTSILALMASMSALMAATLALSGASFRFSRCR